MNQRLPKANLCCILEIKADNEPGISLPVYKKHKTKQKDQKKRRKFPAARVVAGTTEV